MSQVFLFKVLVTGLDGFTGQHLGPILSSAGCDVVGLSSNLTDRDAVFREVLACKPDYVIHLAGISFAAESNAELIYHVNVIGTVNLLDALCQDGVSVKKVVLASSATVYGNVLGAIILSEEMCPRPVSHYGCSKLSMENMAQSYEGKLPFLIVRPFNYTGVGHAEQFLIPKIVNAYKKGMPEIELGNLDVSREFNDVRDVCRIYLNLLLSDGVGLTVNICSGKTISLNRIITMMNQIAGYEINVKVNPLFVRENEIKDLSGDISRLVQLVQPKFEYNIEDTMRWMYGEEDK